MPQFELANFAPQVFWLAVLFAILYFGIIRLTLPKVGNVIAAREHMVKADLDAAHHAKSEADGTRALYERAMSDARHAAQATIGEGKARASAATEARLKDVDSALHAKLGEAEANIARERDAASADIVRIASDAAAEIVASLTGSRPDDQAVSAAVHAARAG